MKAAKKKRMGAMVAEPPKLPGRLYTYQEAGEVLKCHAKTVARLFIGREIVRTNHQTVRITDEQLALFIQERSRKAA